MDTLTNPAPAAVRVECPHLQPVGICPRCKRPHGYHILLSLTPPTPPTPCKTTP